MKPYYQDDAVTLYLGDCREIAPTLGRFDLLLTDPPYGLGEKLQGGTWGKKFEGADKDWDAVAFVGIEDLKSMALDAVIWGGNYYNLHPSRCWLTWFKPDAVQTMANVEHAWTTLDNNSKLLSCSIADTNKERVGHPTQKPLKVMTWCLSFFPDAQTIFDPFAGSGTTGRAAKDLGKKCTMIEREERYCEIIAKRMAQEVLNFK